MYGKIQDHIKQQLAEIESNGLTKNERIIGSPQGAWMKLSDGRKVLNLCANNYLGLSGSKEMTDAAKKGLDDWGFGLSSVRFICGTQELHRELETKLATFLGTDDTILYSSCFDANGGLFETLLSPEDAVFSDALNHASIIDGIRLCKAKRYRYQNADMADLEEKLKSATDARFKLIATDGVFSMDGFYAPLADICGLADKYDALVMVDDSHAVGFTGKTGRGTHELCGVMDRVDIMTGTFGKALGGASGGYTSGRKEIIDLLRQRSRPYLFSNTLAPAVAAASIKAIDMLNESTELRDTLERNTTHFRESLSQLGFELKPGSHPIIPIMFGEALPAVKAADQMLEENVYVIAFSYPVVPKGEARIRTQVSAAHTKDDLDYAVKAFGKVGKDQKVI